jgi:lipid-binding SYLF domain-containing protein
MLARLASIAVLVASALLPIGCGASTMGARISEAQVDLSKVQTSAEKPTREDMKDVKGVALMSVGQGGVGIGGEGGGGVILKRVGGGWGAPFAFDAAAGSIGLQLGGQVKHIMVVFYEEGALKQFAMGGMQLLAVGEGTGGSASGNTRSTNVQYKPFIAGAGLYGGLQLGGLNFTPAKEVNSATYGPSASMEDILNGKVAAPAGTAGLTASLDAMR